MRVVAANKILLAKGETLTHHAIVLDSEHRVVGLVPLVDATVERPFVEFFCGLITTAIPTFSLQPTSLKSLDEYPFSPLVLGYHGEIWLWQGVDYATLIPSSSASYRVL